MLSALSHTLLSLDRKHTLSHLVNELVMLTPSINVTVHGVMTFFGIQVHVTVCTLASSVTGAKFGYLREN